MLALWGLSLAGEGQLQGYLPLRSDSAVDAMPVRRKAGGGTSVVAGTLEM